MSSIHTMTSALTAGLLLGALFYGGLWWTVKEIIASGQLTLWFLGSLIVRMTITLAGFYFVSSGDWQRLLWCLVGFVMARFLVRQLTSSVEKKRLFPIEVNKDSNAH